MDINRIIRTRPFKKKVMFREQGIALYKITILMIIINNNNLQWKC